MENWKFALSSIMSHKMRSILTMLGIIIGVAAVVIIMALGNGMKKSVTDSYTGDKKEVQVYYQEKVSDDSEEDPYAALFGALSEDSQPEVKDDWLKEVAETTPGIDGYYVTNSSSETIAINKRQMENVMITGVSSDYFRIKKDQLMAGRVLQASDYSSFSRIILIDTVLSDELFGAGNYQDALNKVVSVGSKEYRVMGVYKADNSSITMGGLGGAAIMANTQVASEFRTSEVGQIYFHVTDTNLSQSAGSQAAEKLTQLSQSKNGEFTMMDMTELLNQIAEAYGIMTMIIGSIAGISLLVGGIGVMNIMLVSVTERTREIGLRKALGATRRNILLQFLIESVVLTVMGGLIGLLLAFGLSFIIGQVASAALDGMKVTVSLDVAAIAIAFSAVIGIIFGLLPANKASKLDPIEALRYE